MGNLVVFNPDVFILTIALGRFSVLLLALEVWFQFEAYNIIPELNLEFSQVCVKINIALHYIWFLWAIVDLFRQCGQCRKKAQTSGAKSEPIPGGVGEEKIHDKRHTQDYLDAIVRLHFPTQSQNKNGIHILVRLGFHVSKTDT